MDFFTVETPSIRVNAYELSKIVAPVCLYSRPLRKLPDNKLCVLYKERAWPVFLDEANELSIDLVKESYDTKYSELVLQGEKFKIPSEYANHSINAIDFKWDVTSSQFGTYIFCSGLDDIVESLIIYLEDRFGYKVTSWGASDNKGEYFSSFDWFIELSSGLSTAFLGKKIASFCENISSELISKNQDEVLRLKSELESINKKLEYVKVESNEETEFLLEELKKLSFEFEEYRKSNFKGVSEKDIVSQERKEKVKDIKASKTEKILKNVLFNLYPNLAFSPDSTRVIVDRFYESKSIWQILSDLNDGVDVPKTALKGAAVKVGWMELNKHIGTGKDARGRIYIRLSRYKHKYDLVLHWKKNESEQNRLINKICTYSYFDSPKIIFT